MNNTEHLQTLFLELSNMEDRGITIWMEGAISSPRAVASRMHIFEENAYMRDYVFDKGVLTELHFDRVDQL